MGYINWNDYVNQKELDYIEKENDVFTNMFDKLLEIKREEDPDEDDNNTIDCERCSKSITYEQTKCINIFGSAKLVCEKCHKQSKNMDLKLKII